MNLHLFFDVYVEDAPIGVYKRGDRRRFDKDYQIRSSSAAYRFQSKYDITRYTLASYQAIPWASATLRIVCENPAHEAIYGELGKQFPTGSIQRTRSDTTAKYHEALSMLEAEDDSWIFFSPNNDHAFINNLEKLPDVIRDADEAASKLKPDLISIPYSHHTELVNCIKPSQHEWGAYADVYLKLLYETPHSLVVKSNRMLLDSVHLFRKRDLCSLFKTSQAGGRVIRLEDTEHYLSNKQEHVLVIPKFEFCRHYDGYMHIDQKVPPLFIPNGFFESNIQIRYGYDKPEIGCVNINPLAEKFSYQSPDGADLKILLEDIPHFWQSRIGSLDLNPSFPKGLNRGDVPYYLDLENPWRDSSTLRNLFRCYRRYLRYLLRGRPKV